MFEIAEEIENTIYRFRNFFTINHFDRVYFLVRRRALMFSTNNVTVNGSITYVSTYKTMDVAFNLDKDLKKVFSIDRRKRYVCHCGI